MFFIFLGIRDDGRRDVYIQVNSELWMSIAVCWRLLIINLFTVLGDHCWAYMVCVCVYVWHHLSEWIKKEKETNKMHKKREGKDAWATPSDEIRRARFTLVIVGASDAVSHQIERGEGFYKQILFSSFRKYQGKLRHIAAVSWTNVGLRLQPVWSLHGGLKIPPPKWLNRRFLLFFSPRFFSPSWGSFVICMY